MEIRKGLGMPSVCKLGHVQNTNGCIIKEQRKAFVCIKGDV